MIFSYIKDTSSYQEYPNKTRKSRRKLSRSTKLIHPPERPGIEPRLKKSYKDYSDYKPYKNYKDYSKILKPITEKQKKHYHRFLAKEEKLIAALGIGDRYYRINTIINLIPIAILATLPYLIAFGIIQQATLDNRLNLGVLVLLPIVIFVFLPRLVAIMHLRHSKAYIITDRRVLIKEGIFSINLTSAPLDKITHLKVREEFLSKKLYNVGDIVIHTAGPTPVEMHLLKVASPMEVKNLIEDWIFKEKQLTKSKEDSNGQEDRWGKIRFWHKED